MLLALRSELAAAGNEPCRQRRRVAQRAGGMRRLHQDSDLDGRLQFMSEGGKRVMEVEDFGPLKGCPWPDFWSGKAASKLGGVVTAKAGGTGRFKGPGNTAKGNPRYWDVQVSPIMGVDGKPSHLLSISRDITDEWRAISELQGSRRAAGGADAGAAASHQEYAQWLAPSSTRPCRGHMGPARRFSARLMTLSRAHDLLTQASWASRRSDLERRASRLIEDQPQIVQPTHLHLLTGRQGRSLSPATPPPPQAAGRGVRVVRSIGGQRSLPLLERRGLRVGKVRSRLIEGCCR